MKRREFMITLLGGAIVWPLAARAQPAQPAPPPAVAPAPRLKLTAEQEYIIREIILKDLSVPKERSVSETVGDIVPENVELYPLPSEIIQKVPSAQSHKFVVKDDETIVLISPSDRRIADVIKKKSSD